MDAHDCKCYVYVISNSVEDPENWKIIEPREQNSLGKFTVTVEARDTDGQPTPLIYTNNDCRCCQSTSVLIFDRSVAAAQERLPRNEIDPTPLEGVEIQRTNGNQWTITVDPSQIPNAVYRELQNGNNTALCISFRTLRDRQVAVEEPASSTRSTTAASYLNSVIPESMREWLYTYQAVIVIVIASSLSTLISPIDHMDTFMGVYMMLFAILQLRDIHETATRLGRYDVLAKIHPIMGYLIPGMNLLLGLWHLNGVPSITQSLITGSFSLVKSIGPWNVMRQRESVTCGCVGSSGNMRVGVVTFLEEAVMAVLCAIQLQNMLGNEGPHDPHP